MLGAVGALAVTLGLLFLGLHLLRRIHGVQVSGRGIPLEILQRVSTGPKQGVALLRVDDRVLVVSVLNGVVNALYTRYASVPFGEIAMAE